MFMFLPLLSSLSHTHTHCLSFSLSLSLTHNTTHKQPTQYCPCGYQLQWSLTRPIGYRTLRKREEQRRRNDWCGKYFSRNVSLFARQSIIIGSLLVLICGVVLIFAFGVQPARTLTLVYLGVIGAVILAVANGANDIANSMGTSVGAGAYYCLYFFFFFWSTSLY